MTKAEGRLDLGGLAPPPRATRRTDATREASRERSRKTSGRPGKSQRTASSRARKQVPTKERVRCSVRLPPPEARDLRDWARAERRSHDDIVMTAYIAHIDEVIKEAEAPRGDPERAALGLPPLDREPKEHVIMEQVSVTMARAARDRLDGDASKLDMTRSALVSKLLRMACASR